MSWDGVDRRKIKWECPVECVLKESVEKTSLEVVEIKGDLKLLNSRINGAFDKIATYMDSGVWWRRTIVGIVFTIILQASGGFIVATQLASRYGQNQRQIDVNTHRLDIVEEQLRNEPGTSRP